MRLAAVWLLTLTLLLGPFVGSSAAAGLSASADCTVDISEPTNPRWSKDCFTVNKPRPRPDSCTDLTVKPVPDGCGDLTADECEVRPVTHGGPQTSPACSNATAEISLGILLPGSASSPAGELSLCGSGEEPCKLAMRTELTVNTTLPRTPTLRAPTFTAIGFR